MAFKFELLGLWISYGLCGSIWTENLNACAFHRVKRLIRPRPVARKILQARLTFKYCARIEFYKLLALYHADKVVVWHCREIQNEECVDSFNDFLLLHCWGCLRLNLLNTYAKNKQKKNPRKFQPRQVLATALSPVPCKCSLRGKSPTARQGTNTSLSLEPRKVMTWGQVYLCQSKMAS